MWWSTLGPSLLHSCVLLLWKGGEESEVVPTPGRVVLGKDRLVVMSSGAGSSTCRRTKMEEWSREQLAMLQTARKELPTSSLAWFQVAPGKKSLPARTQGESNAFTSFLSHFKSSDKVWAFSNSWLAQCSFVVCLTLNTVLILLALVKLQHEL